MQRDIISILMDKENRCKNLQKQARLAFEKNGMSSCEEQCNFLQQAADLEFEMSTQTSGAERDHHIREKNRLDYEIMKIRSELDGSSRKKSGDEDSDKKTIKNENTNKTGKKSTEEEDLERIARTWYKEAPAHSFKDVSGMVELKKKLEGCISDKNAADLMDYLKIPRLNTYFFVGPPGCGKTFIIEAFAHELMNKDYKYMSVQGSDIISRYVGAAEKNVTKLFEEAEKNSPCILFIDEVDSLCKSRSLPNLPEYAANITTQFLTGYNRIHSADSEVIFIAATNYPNRVDGAMLDRSEIVRVPLPDVEAREAALKMYFDGILQLQKGFTYRDMAEKIKRYNYRDIERLATAIKRMVFRELLDIFKIDEKAIEALTTGKFKLTRSKFESIIDKFAPSPKETILNDLKEWERKIASIANYDDLDIDSLYESDLNTENNNKQIEFESEVVTEEIPSNRSSEPVYPAQDKFCPVPGEYGVTVSFYVSGAHSIVHANINGESYEVNKNGDTYSIVYRPEPDEEEAEVFVSSDNEYIGSFTAVFGKPISNNSDFNI